MQSSRGRTPNRVCDKESLGKGRGPGWGGAMIRPGWGRGAQRCMIAAHITKIGYSLLIILDKLIFNFWGNHFEGEKVSRENFQPQCNKIMW